MSGGERAYNSIDSNGDAYQAVSMSWPNKKQAPPEYFIPLVHPKTKKECPVPSRGWRNPPQTMRELLSKNLIIFGDDETTQPRCKYLLKDHLYENIPSLLYNGGSDLTLLKKMGIPFDTPKMVSICKEHIASFTSNDDIIMDFFSGSGTIAHAVMEQNIDDGQNRSFIMVQLPELKSASEEMIKAGFKNICELGKERIRRAGKMYSSNDIDAGFRVFKIGSSNMNDIFYNPQSLKKSLLDYSANNIKPHRTHEDLLFQVMLELGIELSASIKPICEKKAYSVDDGYLIACFNENIDDDLVTEIAKMKPKHVVFRDSSIANDSVAINFEQIFKTYSPNTQTKVL